MDRPPRDLQDLGGLFRGQSSEVAELYDLMTAGIDGGELVEDTIQVQVLAGAGEPHREILTPGDSFLATTTLRRDRAPRMVHEDLAHGARRAGEEVSASFQIEACGPDETDVGFVDENRWGHRGAGRQAGELAGSDVA